MSKSALELEVSILDSALQQLSQHSQEASAIFAQEVNIHQHTVRLGELCTQYFMPFDQQFSISDSTMPLATVIAEINAFTAQQHPDKGASVKTILGSIADGAVVAETNLVLSEQLIRTWSLAKHAFSPANTMDLIVENLHHNIAADGGCLPGISARLIQPYMAILKHIAQSKLGYKQQELQFSDNHNMHRHTSHVNHRGHNSAYDDKDLAEALSRSMLPAFQVHSSQHPAFKPHNGADADYDLEEALRRSILPENQAPSQFVPHRSEEDDFAEAVKRSLGM